MMAGSFALGICMMMVAILLSFRGTAIEHSTSSASVAFFFLYMLCFGASVNCIPWVYVPEILPLHARSKGTAVGISSNWLWNFVIVMITPVIITDLQWKAYLILQVILFLIHTLLTRLIACAQTLHLSPWYTFAIPKQQTLHLKKLTLYSECQVEVQPAYPVNYEKKEKWESIGLIRKWVYHYHHQTAVKSQKIFT
jgi:MFS family permease